MHEVMEISCIVFLNELWNFLTDYIFDRRLEQAISETSQEREFQAIYQESLEAQLTKEVLLDVARATGHILRHNSEIETIQEEASLWW